MNRGAIAVLGDDGSMRIRRCSCMGTRKTLKQIECSGLSGLMDRCTFENWQNKELWQKQALEKAKSFVREYEGKFMIMCGQVGSGKTHLCTAVVGELLRQGVPAQYSVWDVTSKRLKASIMDSEAYSREVNHLQTIKLLYVDDFLKVKSGCTPTDADIKLAFEIINYRYNTETLSTVISSEFLIDEIIEIDEALGSRILERAGAYTLNINRDRTKNFRLHSRA